jgi:insertion element IS1 protein InsB
MLPEYLLKFWLLSGFNVAFWCTDNFSAYGMLPDEKHIKGKLYTADWA